MNLPCEHSMHVVKEVPRERQVFNITLRNNTSADLKTLAASNKMAFLDFLMA